MVSKWVISPILTNHLLTSWDIQVGALEFILRIPPRKHDVTNLFQWLAVSAR